MDSIRGGERRRRKTINLLCAGLLAAVLWAGGCGAGQISPWSGGRTHLIHDLSPRGEEGWIQVLVEIPAGTNAKWEVEKSRGDLRWELQDGRPRVVDYLPYPSNYGMVPRTLLPREAGGDGDPLDVVVLGPALPRGSVASARLVGVLRLRDGGETDDKLLAVAQGSPLADVESLEELRRRYPGVTEILQTWFANYKGADRIEILGYAPASAPWDIFVTAELAYTASRRGANDASP